MALVLLSLVLHARLHVRSTRPWLVVARMLYAATIAATGFGIDPLENDFDATRDVTTALDVSEVRADLGEDRWVLLNSVRLVTTTAAFACLVWSLVLLGRATSRPDEATSRQTDGAIA